MNFLYLKRARVLISILFFISTLIIFLNINEWLTSKSASVITYLQFVPSLVKFLSVVGFSTFGFVFIIAVTFVWGRVYCSSICPLGTLQDIVSYLSRKISRKKNHFLLKPYSIIRYSILCLTIIFLISGSLFLLNLLDPFSNFGRIISNLVRPIVFYIRNFISGILESVNLFFLTPADLKNIDLISVAIGLTVLIVVVAFSYKKGRLFCNTICPVGTLLGIFSRFSIYKIAIDESTCKSCNLCERECKAGCIDKKNKVIDFSRCISCYNCFNACHSDGIVYVNTVKTNTLGQQTDNDDRRRVFIKSLLVYLASLSGLSIGQIKIIPIKESTVPVYKKFPVSPPGSQSIVQFTSSCTACHLCVSACPTQVLQPSFLEYGFTGMLQPRLDNIAGFCNFECKICGDVCPTGAILPVELEKKKLVQLGKAKFVEDNCIVKTQKTDCGACSEHCPTKAVHMIPYEGKLVIPEVRDKYCIGCGACEFACPVTPYKAIYIEGNSVHLLAEKNTELKEQQKVDLKEEFPF